MKRYTTRQKNDILRQLLLNAGDVALTSAQTGVPENTLYRWRREALRPLPAPPPEPKSPPPPLAALTELPAITNASHPLSIGSSMGRGQGGGVNSPAQDDSFSPLPEFGEGAEGVSQRLTEGSFAAPVQGVGSIAGGRGSDPLPTLRQRLIDHAFRISDSLDASLEDAPLSQRAQALSQIIDRIMKLSAIQPQEQVIRIEYEYPEDDPAYRPPSESEDHYDQ